MAALKNMVVVPLLVESWRALGGIKRLDSHRSLAAVTSLGLTARGYDRVRKVARTIADLAEAEAISADHVAEALNFRM